jgi:hypothetical protein
MKITCVGFFSVGSASAFEEFNSSETFGLLQSVPRDNLLVEEADTVDVGEHSHTDPHQAYCWNVDKHNRNADCEDSCRNADKYSAHCKVVDEFTTDNTNDHVQCFCLGFAAPVSPPPPTPPPALKKCKWGSKWTESKGFLQECTDKRLEQFKKKKNGRWTSLGQPVTPEEWAPEGACVAWVKTSDLNNNGNQDTCKKFCQRLGKQCVKAEDDAKQVPCTIHQRKPRDIMCTQKRITQMCACK